MTYRFVSIFLAIGFQFLTKLSVYIVSHLICMYGITLFLNCVILRHNEICNFYGCLIELYGDSDFEIAFW